MISMSGPVWVQISMSGPGGFMISMSGPGPVHDHDSGTANGRHNHARSPNSDHPMAAASSARSSHGDMNCGYAAVLLGRLPLRSFLAACTPLCYWVGSRLRSFLAQAY